jgi:dTDP-4-amino-4,6-dideoxygalactose transaminase
VLAGGVPVLVDVEPGTLNMDVERLADAIGPRTRAIMPVHFAGLPVDLDPVYALAAQHGLRVLEDCAHAIGAEYKSQRIGSFGDTHVFSFHPNKNITTGEGGAVVSADDDLLRTVSQLRFHGIDREAFNRFARGGSQHYDVVTPGFKYNMLDMQAALGLHQLPRLDGFIERRTQLVQRYRAALAGVEGLSYAADPAFAHRHAWHLFTILVNGDGGRVSRDAFMDALKTRGIGTGLHYTAAHLFTYYREKFGFHEGQFPIAEKICAQIVSLPLFPDMTDAQQDFVVETLTDVLASPTGAR